MGGDLALLGEAEALARALDDQARLGRVLARMALVLRLTGDLDGAIAAGRQALELAVANSAIAPCRHKHPIPWGTSTHAIGDFGQAAELLRRIVEAADRESGTPRTDVRISAPGVAGADLERAWGLRRGPAPRGGGAPPRHAGRPRGHTHHCPPRPRPPVPHSRGPGALPSGCWSRGLALCRASGNRVSFLTDRDGPGLCLCAPGAPRGGARAAGGGGQRRCPHWAELQGQARSGRSAQ